MCTFADLLSNETLCFGGSRDLPVNQPIYLYICLLTSETCFGGLELMWNPTRTPISWSLGPINAFVIITFVFCFCWRHGRAPMAHPRNITNIWQINAKYMRIDISIMYVIFILQLLHIFVIYIYIYMLQCTCMISIQTSTEFQAGLSNFHHETRLFRFGCVFRKCVLPEGLAKELPKMIQSQNVWTSQIVNWF